MEVDKLNEELRQLDATIADLEDILQKPERVRAIVRNDLEDIKNRYPTPRKTEISTDYADIGEEDLIEREDVVISMTHMGYVKRIATKECKVQRRGGKGVTAHKPKEEDFVVQVAAVHSHSNLLMFTNRGKVYVRKAYQIPESSKVAKGTNIVNIIDLDEGESVTTMLSLSDYPEGEYLKGLVLYVE